MTSNRLHPILLARRGLTTAVCTAGLCALATTASAQSVVSYGTGTAGTGGLVPDLWVNSSPYLGNTNLALVVEDALGSTFAVPGLGLTAGSTMAVGVEFLIDPGLLLTLPLVLLGGSGAGDGSGVAPLPLPNHLSFLGLPIFSQAYVFDPGAPGGLLSASQGVHLTLSLPGLILANTSVGGNSDPQYAIDEATGTVVDFSNGTVNNSPPHEFSVNGDLAFVGQGLGSANVQAFSAGATALTPLTTTALAGPGFPWMLRAHPDGQRLFVIPNAPLNSVPIGEILDADQGSPAFMQPHPSGTIDLTDLHDAIGFEFDEAGDFGFLGMLGFISPNQAEVVKVDLRPASPTQYQIVGRVGVPNLMWAMTGSPDGSLVVCHTSGFGGSTGELAVIDTATLTILDADPGTPGTQLIGGEVSFPRTPITSGVISMTFDPRGRAIYLGESGFVRRLVFDPSDPAHLTMTSAALANSSDFVWGIAVSDAGDRIYMTVPGAIQERDSRTLAVLRSFATPSNTSGVTVR